jgi:hypothetical protein
MSTYSTQLFIGTLPPELTTLYTAPNGSVTVVRDVELFCNTAANSLFYLGVAKSGIIVPLIAAGTAEALQHFQWQGRVVLQPGDQVVGNSGGPSMVCAASGYDLAG